MATLATVTMTPLSRSYSLLTAGAQLGYVAANGGGDFAPLGGQYTLVAFKTTGTASVITIDSVLPSSYGQDNNITITMAATDEQEQLIKNDGRFDQGGGNAGLMALTYTSVVGLSVRARVIP